MQRIVDIATEGLRLSVHRGFLLVHGGQSEEVGRVPLDDIHAVLVHAHDTTWSASLVARLAERGAPIVFCAANHSPVAVTLPLDGHHAQGARMQAQCDASGPLKKQLWRRIVSAKITMQGSLLAARGVEAGAFPLLARRVKSGDPDNVEAQAARRYWPLLMGQDFRRNRDLPGSNALLNYGYAVMRATVARAVVAAGLHPTIGIQHSNRRNAFALADDLVEPFRPLVDGLAAALTDRGISTLDSPTKRAFARLIAFGVTIQGEMTPVSVAAQRLAGTMSRSFESGRADLALFTQPSATEWRILGKPGPADCG